MRKLMLVFSVLFLVACGSEDATTEVESNATDAYADETEILFDREHDIVLVDSEEITVSLTKSRQERIEDVQDFMKLMFDIENKENRTYDFYFSEIQLDGETYKAPNVLSTDGVVKGDEELEVITVIDSFDEISFDEYIGGKLVYKDYEGNRYELEFNEYINE